MGTRTGIDKDIIFFDRISFFIDRKDTYAGYDDADFVAPLAVGIFIALFIVDFTNLVKEEGTGMEYPGWPPD